MSSQQLWFKVENDFAKKQIAVDSLLQNTQDCTLKTHYLFQVYLDTKRLSEQDGHLSLSVYVIYYLPKGST